MPRIPEDMSRRSFLGAGAAALTASGLAASQTAAADNTATPGIGVSTLVDALNAVGRDGTSQALSTDISPLTRLPGMVTGPAVTTKWQSGLGRMTGDDVRENMFVPLDEAAQGSIWIVAGNSDRLISLFGGVIAAACKRNGLAAAITDNGCRDVDTFNDIEFPVFAKSAVPFGPGEFSRPVAANVPVICGGVEINPGDTVAADRDGIVVIPSDVHDEVYAAANEIAAKERSTMDKIDAGDSLVDAYEI
jgi:regulator of RNase E activity RraA